MMKTQVEGTVVRGRSVDLGVYVNADDIARILREKGTLDLAGYKVKEERRTLRQFAISSGLLSGRFPMGRFRMGHRLNGSVFTLVNERFVEHYAQLLAAYLCDQLLKQRIKFSFETVFSHPSKVDLMRRAHRAGYKVYLYYICTNAPEINVDRIKSRVSAGGHDVPKRKVIERYSRSLKQILPAMEHCYHAFMFDNTDSHSANSGEPVMFAEMKRTEMGRQWGWTPERTPDWFLREFLFASSDTVYRYMGEEVLKARADAEGE